MHSELIVKHNVGLKTRLQQGISESAFYGDGVHFKRIIGKPSLPDQVNAIVFMPGYKPNHDTLLWYAF